MSTNNNTYECTELNNISKGLYNTDSNTPSCPELYTLNTMLSYHAKMASIQTDFVGGGGSVPSCQELSNLNNLIKNSNTNDNLNIFNNQLKIMDYSGAPIYILLLIAIIANIFLAIPFTPVFITGFLCLIILILILAMLCIYLIHMLLFQEKI
ncbi:MAG: hypothetical protein ACOVNU_05675 [Candidatus Kapaibacteriota bacterium]|jgi:hypothetical protein